MKHIAIIGAGWLGVPVAKALLDEGNKVVATRRSDERLSELTALSLPAFRLNLDSNNDFYTEEAVSQLMVRDIDTVIGAFPPGFRRGEGEAYALNWQQLTDICVSAGVKKIVMISSTTVYPDEVCEMKEEDASFALAREDDRFSENARVMLRAEQSVIDSGIDYCILRCSGLYGPDRHPARFVTKIPSVSAVAPVNMVHQDDAVSAVLYSVSHLANQVVNVTSPETVSKEEFYQEAIRHYDSALTLPQSNSKGGKTICPKKLLGLGFRFKYPKVTDGLPHC